MKRLLIGAAVASLLASPVFAQSGGGVVTVPPAPYTQACGSVSVSTVCWGVTETFNASGTAFSAPLQVAVTDTAAASGSMLFNVLGGSAATTSYFSVDHVGTINMGASASANAITTAIPALTVQRRYNEASTAFNLVDLNFVNAASANTSDALRILQSGTCESSWGYWGWPLVLGSCNNVGTAGEDPTILITRGINTSGPTSSGNAHGIEDVSPINRTGVISYNSYNAGPSFNDNGGATSFGHYVAFQTAPVFQMGGSIGANASNPVTGLLTEITTVAGSFGNPTITWASAVDSLGWQTPAVGTLTSYRGIYIGNNNPASSTNWSVESLFPYPSTFAGPMALCLVQSGSAGSNTSACTTSVNYISPTAPTITSGLGTSPTIQANGTAAGKITAGSGSPTTTTVLGLPTNANGWVCLLMDETSGKSATQTGDTASSVTETWAVAPTAADKIVYSCHGY